MKQTKIESIFENSEAEVVHVEFIDGEEYWFKIIDCSHVKLNGTVWADRISSVEVKKVVDPYGIQFNVSEVKQVRDIDNKILFIKTKR